MLFGIGRAIGTLANITWDRALGYPLERPKSLTTAMLEEDAAGLTCAGGKITSPSGKAVTNVSMAANAYGAEVPEWLNLVAWERVAEVMVGRGVVGAVGHQGGQEITTLHGAPRRWPPRSQARSASPKGPPRG